MNRPQVHVGCQCYIVECSIDPAWVGRVVEVTRYFGIHAGAITWEIDAAWLPKAGGVRYLAETSALHPISGPPLKAEQRIVTMSD